MRGIFLGCRDMDFKPADSDDRVQGMKIIITCPDPDWLGSGVTIPFLRMGSPLYNKIKGHESEYINKTVDVDYLPGSGGRLKISDITIREKS